MGILPMETEYARSIRADKESAEIAAKGGFIPSSSSGLRFFMWISSYYIGILPMETEYARSIRADKESAEIAAKGGFIPSSSSGLRFFMWISSYYIGTEKQDMHGL